MSKTFKCVEHEEEVLDVLGYESLDDGRRFALTLPHVGRNEGVALCASTAPALALAVLEEAGVAESSDAGVAAQYLRAHMAEQERVTAEAKEQAELEAEALKLCNAAIRQEDGAIYDSFSQVTTPGLWLAVARKAREIGAEK